MSVSKDNLLATIKNLKKIILKEEANSNSLTEQDTRQGLINKLFRELGWDFSDFNAVKSEFRHPKYNEAVDYAFFSDDSGDKPTLLVEAKSLGRNLNDGKIIKQLCSYMGQIGVQWGVLTDGNKYVMYNSNAGISYEDQKFLTLQIKTADTEDGIPSEELAEKFIALLSRDSLENGGIQKFFEKHAINTHIKDAMWSLFSEPLDTLASAIKREFKQERVANPNLRISTQQIVSFLDTLKDEEGRIPISLDDYATPSDDVVFHEVSDALSQQKDADVDTITRAKRVTISDLLEENIIKSGDNWRCMHKGEVSWGRITANGEIEVNGKHYQSPSKAGSAVTQKSCDGWNFWHYKNYEGEWRRVNVLREQYREKHGLEATGRRR